MDNEVIRYKKILEARNADKPIWEKKCLSIEEAAAYSGIGITKLRQLWQLLLLSVLAQLLPLPQVKRQSRIWSLILVTGMQIRFTAKTVGVILLKLI